jgi:hypothetical protein
MLPPFAVMDVHPECRVSDLTDGGRALLDKCGGRATGVLEFAQAARPSNARMAEKIRLPPAQFEAEFERETTRRAGEPMFKLFFPAAAEVRKSHARAEVRRALLSAAFALQLDGPDALRTLPEPSPAVPIIASPPGAAPRFTPSFPLPRLPSSFHLSLPLQGLKP